MWQRLWRRVPALVLCAAVGLGASGVLLARRAAVERSYRTVEITIDGDDWATLAGLHGLDRAALYERLYRRGVRSVTVYAASLRRLGDEGAISYLSGSDGVNAARAGTLGGALGGLARAGQLRVNDTYVQGPARLLDLIRNGIAVQRGPSAARLLRGGVLAIDGRGRDLEDLSLGVDPAEVAAARRAHLAADVRVRNFRDVAPGGLDRFFDTLAREGRAFTLIFDRDQVLGYDTLIPDVAAAMKTRGFAFGRIEAFAASRAQKGEGQLARLVAPLVIRVFSVTPQELATLTPAQARDKYVLAAHERNVRILYVRPFLSTSAGVDPIQANLDYVGSIADDLTRSGYKLGKAVPLPPIGTPEPWFALAALAALAAAALAAAETGDALGWAGLRLQRHGGLRAEPVRPPAGSLYGGVAAGLAITLGAIALHHVTLWREVLALLAALASPVLAMLWLVPGARRGTWPAVRTGGAAVLGQSLARVWAMSAVSALGGIVAAALLSQWAFMLEIREFLGVKAALVVPVVVIGLAIAAAQAGEGGAWRPVREWLGQPLRVGYGIALIVVGGLALFALGRTGNSGLPALGGLELKLRMVLSHVLVARPRTKEFLIGHPAMMLAAALALLGARRWVLPAAMVGAVGQVGLVNSFSHIHTPLVYTLDRTAYALVIGSLIGGVLVGALLASRRWWRVPVQAPGAGVREAAAAGGSRHTGGPRAGEAAPLTESAAGDDLSGLER